MLSFGPSTHMPGPVTRPGCWASSPRMAPIPDVAMGTTYTGHEGIARFHRFMLNSHPTRSSSSASAADRAVAATSLESGAAHSPAHSGCRETSWSTLRAVYRGAARRLRVPRGRHAGESPRGQSAAGSPDLVV
jgi:hypothetical protein